jgi:hypothetical protein
MAFVAVLCVLLLFIAALGQSFWWRAQPQPGQPWYGLAGGAAYAWGVFLLALYVTWPTIHDLIFRH